MVVWFLWNVVDSSKNQVKKCFWNFLKLYDALMYVRVYAIWYLFGCLENMCAFGRRWMWDLVVSGKRVIRLLVVFIGSCSGHVSQRFVSAPFMLSGRPGWHEPDPWTRIAHLNINLLSTSSSLIPSFLTNINHPLWPSDISYLSMHPCYLYSWVRERF